LIQRPHTRASIRSKRLCRVSEAPMDQEDGEDVPERRRTKASDSFMVAAICVLVYLCWILGLPSCVLSVAAPVRLYRDREALNLLVGVR
jgi:hypothetical protein